MKEETARKRGRPAITGEARRRLVRTETIDLSFTEIEVEEFGRRAENAGLPLRTYLRELLLDAGPSMRGADRGFAA